MSDTNVTLVINGEEPSRDNVIGDVVRLLVADLEPKALEVLQTAIIEQVMPAIKEQVGAAVTTVITDFQTNGWPEIDRRAILTGNKTTLANIVTNLILHAFGASDVNFDTYPSPYSLAVEPSGSGSVVTSNG